MKRLILLYLICLFFSNGYSQININSGLVANYPFSGNANDTGPFLNNGIVHGATLTTDRFGTPNSAYHFDGLDDYIDVDADSNLSASNYQLSISLWVKIESFDTSPNKKAYILQKSVNDGYSSDWGVMYYDKDNNPAIEQLRFCGPLFTPWGDGGGTITVTGYWSTTVPTLNTWYHIIINHDLNNAQEIFINGVSESIGGNGGNSTSFWQNTANLIIGKAADDSSHFHGVIDDVKIYNRILAQDEVMYLFNGTLGVSHLDSLEVNVYPNPSVNNLFVQNGIGHNISTYEIFDDLGKSQIVGNLKENKIDISCLESGIYFIRFKSTNEAIFIKKFIKQ